MSLTLPAGSSVGQIPLTFEGGNFRVNFRRSVWRVTALIFLFSIAYSSPQLFPSIEYSQLAYRWVSKVQATLAADRVAYSIAGEEYNLRPQGLLAAVSPYLSSVENSPYWGILPLAFLIFSVKELRTSKLVRLCWLLALCFLALALGEYSPLHGLFYALVPFYDKGREASRHLLLVHFSLSLLAGFGFQTLFRPWPKRHRAFRWRTLQIFTTLGLLVTLVVFAGYFYLTLVLYKPANYDVLFFSCLLLLASSLLLACRHFVWLDRKSLKAGVYILLLFDYHFFLSPHFKPKRDFDGKRNFEPKQYYQQDEVIQFLRSQPGTFRVDLRDERYPRNIGQVYKFETMNGHGATRLKQFSDLKWAEPSPGNRISDLFNVKYIVSKELLSLPQLLETRETKVYENPDYLPRAWLVSKVTVTENTSQISQTLLDASFNPREEALLESSLDSRLNSLGKKASKEFSPDTSLPMPQVRFERQSPNRFTVETQTPQPAFLVISQNWYPGWKAKVNGKSEPVKRVDGALMGVYLGSGSSKVAFSFRPTHFYWGVSLSSLALLTLALTFLLRAARLSDEFPFTRSPSRSVERG